MNFVENLTGVPVCVIHGLTIEMTTTHRMCGGGEEVELFV